MRISSYALPSPSRSIFSSMARLMKSFTLAPRAAACAFMMSFLPFVTRTFISSYAFALYLSFTLLDVFPKISASVSSIIIARIAYCVQYAACTKCTRSFCHTFSRFSIDILGTVCYTIITKQRNGGSRKHRTKSGQYPRERPKGQAIAEKIPDPLPSQIKSEV